MNQRVKNMQTRQLLEICLPFSYALALKVFTPLTFALFIVNTFSDQCAATKIVFACLNKQGFIDLSSILHAVKCHAISSARYVDTNPTTA